MTDNAPALGATGALETSSPAAAPEAPIEQMDHEAIRRYVLEAAALIGAVLPDWPGHLT
jgi:hypothetical protein